MVGLLARTFYNHTPEIPEGQRQPAAASGEKRFNQFLDALAAQLAPGQSALERMPEPAVVTAADVLDPDEDADLAASDDNEAQEANAHDNDDEQE